jgi:uncharacterized protein
MGEVSRYPNGTFCWVDLGTPDVPGAKAFYRELFGWDAEDLPAGPGGTSTVCRLKGRDVAAIHEQVGDARAVWGSYLSVDDVDATTARARALGGTVLAEPVDVLDAGRMAVVADPSGAAVSLWQPRGRIGAGLVNEVGAWTWNELVSPDVAGAGAFYADLLGWTVGANPGPFPRTSFTLGELLVGGGHAPTEPEGDAPRWTISFRVADADESAASARRLGGRVLLPPLDVPVGRFAILADPAGAPFTVAAMSNSPFRGVDGS